VNILSAINWRIFAVLLVAGLAGVLAGLPYIFDMFRERMQAARPTRLSIPVLILLGLLQNGILLAVAIGAGMTLSRQVGLRMPLLEAWLDAGPPVDVPALLLPGLLLGLVVGVALLIAEGLFFLPRLPPAVRDLAVNIPLWKRLLAGALYGGIVEELLMRLFLFSLLAWLLGRVWHTPDGLPTDGAFWAANVLTALLFGLGHLPATAALAPLTPLIVARALLLNGVAGIVFGVLYWRYGLETAMMAHFSAHLALQLLGPPLARRATASAA
jgi:membrane protease YdiL (CAAX protease family)